MIINNNEGSSWYSRKKSAWYCKPWIKLAAFIRSLYFAISLYKNYFSSPKIAKTNTVLRCYAYLYIFLRKLDRKQPSNTTHGRCLTSKSTKVPDKKKKTNTCFSRVIRTRTIIIPHFVHRKSRHTSQRTSEIRYLPARTVQFQANTNDLSEYFHSP